MKAGLLKSPTTSDVVRIATCRRDNPTFVAYRAFSREILERLDLTANFDDFVFDNQMLAQILWHGFTMGEVSCPTKYFAEASSINFQPSVKYGFGCLATGLAYRLAKLGWAKSKLFGDWR